jgi:hypothetical protein
MVLFLTVTNSQGRMLTVGIAGLISRILPIVKNTSHAMNCFLHFFRIFCSLWDLFLVWILGRFKFTALFNHSEVLLTIT